MCWQKRAVVVLFAAAETSQGFNVLDWEKILDVS